MTSFTFLKKKTRDKTTIFVWVSFLIMNTSVYAAYTKKAQANDHE